MAQANVWVSHGAGRTTGWQEGDAMVSYLVIPGYPWAGLVRSLWAHPCYSKPVFSKGEHKSGLATRRVWLGGHLPREMAHSCWWHQDTLSALKTVHFLLVRQTQERCWGHQWAVFSPQGLRIITIKQWSHGMDAVIYKEGRERRESRVHSLGHFTWQCVGKLIWPTTLKNICGTSVFLCCQALGSSHFPPPLFLVALLIW